MFLFYSNILLNVVNKIFAKIPKDFNKDTTYFTDSEALIMRVNKC